MEAGPEEQDLAEKVKIVYRQRPSQALAPHPPPPDACRLLDLALPRHATHFSSPPALPLYIQNTISDSSPRTQ